MTTLDDAFLDLEICENDDDEDEDDFYNIIMDLSNPLKNRIKALENYYHEQDNGDNTIEIINTLSGMYQMSGSGTIEQFFINICTNCNISSFLKLEVVKSLLEYEDIEEGSDSDEDEITRESRELSDTRIRDNNSNRKIISYRCLNTICKELSDLPTPCRVEAICRLMNSGEFKSEANDYFCKFICDKDINCDYRYKVILSLENKSCDNMKEELSELFNDKEFVKMFYNKLQNVIEKLFPDVKYDINNLHLWEEIIYRLVYEDIKDIYRETFPDKCCIYDLFIRSAHLAFLFNTCIDEIYYRNLSGQYLLQKCKINDTTRFKVENQLQNFTMDKHLEYNRRADSADILLQLGSHSMKIFAKEIIEELGKKNGVVRTVFENAQNVHIQEVEESVSEALEFLSCIPVYQVEGKEIDFNYIHRLILDHLKTEKQKLLKPSNGKYLCKHCLTKYNSDRIIIEPEDDDELFCSFNCIRFYHRDEKIKIALNRILMDRALYSKYSSTLNNILVKVYTYIVTYDDPEIKKQMFQRMLEELEEMSGTCSSGYATRLINIISGFGKFNIRISWEDQIMANFNGRLNAMARDITSPNNKMFRVNKLYDIIELWLRYEENTEILHRIEEQLNPTNKIENHPKMKNIIQQFLVENKEIKINRCIEDFSEMVLNEIMIPSSNFVERKNFWLFFRSYISIIREELYQEFKDYVTDTDFDLYFRKSIMKYEND